MKHYIFEHCIFLFLGVLATITLYMFANGFNIVIILIAITVLATTVYCGGDIIFLAFDYLSMEVPLRNICEAIGAATPPP